MFDLGQSVRPRARGAADFDLELIEHRTLDAQTQQLTDKPSRHG